MYRIVLILSLVATTLFLGGCNHAVKKVNIDRESANIGEIQISRAMPKSGNVRDAKRGNEQWFAYGAMSGHEGINANGITSAHFFDNGQYVLSVQLNIEIPEDGTFYEVWLKGDDHNFIVSAGHLTNRLGDVRHALTFESDEDLRHLQEVIVTVEMDDGNPEPNRTVAKGILKVVER